MFTLGIAVSQFACAQSVGSPSEPIQLMPPRALPQKILGHWNQLPRDGIVLDPGASDAFDAADPVSPFQSNQGVGLPFGSRVFKGLPDVDPMDGQGLRSELVSEIQASDDDKAESTRGARQRSEQQRRLVDTFPLDYLLDSVDPGLFQFLDGDWIPTPSDVAKESKSRLERAADAAWQELRPQLLSKLQSCDSLLRKNSVHSARDEIRNGLTLLARKLDQLLGPGGVQAQQRKLAIRRSMPHESALQHAIRQIDECTYAPRDEVPATLQTFMDLVPQATMNHPWAADLLYALGKTYEQELEYAPKYQEVLREQSLVCYQAALRIAPKRGYISNQLGYSYLHVGSLDEATKALQQALDAGPTAYSWRNLAELYRRRGLVREAQLADQQADFLISESSTEP
jgi:tetratricopeptide (TPR) repeat protein